MACLVLLIQCFKFQPAVSPLVAAALPNDVSFSDWPLVYPTIPPLVITFTPRDVSSSDWSPASPALFLLDACVTCPVSIGRLCDVSSSDWSPASPALFLLVAAVVPVAAGHPADRTAVHGSRENVHWRVHRRTARYVLLSVSLIPIYSLIFSAWHFV